MSLTKETIGPTATQDPGRPRAASGQRAEASGHPQPVCIEVPVTVQGVRPATDPGKREPFTESSRTVIVFANGAVLRLGTAVNPGQLIFLTNEHTKKEVVCQVVKSKTYHNVAGYVELEFTEPTAGFWGIHFPGERSAPQNEPQAPALLPQGSSTVSPRPGSASVSVPPVKAAEGARVPQIKSHPAAAVPAEIPRARKEAPRVEEKLPATDLLSRHPELIRPAPAASPRSGGSASVSEPLVFSSTKRSVTPAVSVPEPHKDEHAAPTFRSHALFEEEPETQSAEAKPRRMPVGALIAAGLILAAAGGGWYWWHKSGRPNAANSSLHAANAAALVTPPANTQTAPPLSSPLPSSSAAAASGTSKGVEASGHPSAPAPAQPVNASLISHETSQPLEKPAETHESATRADKKPAHAGFRMSAPSAVRRPTSSARNVEPAPGVDSAPAVPGAASPEGISGLVGSASLRPEAPKPELPSGGELKQARLVSSSPPTYPPLARSQRVEGDVTVDALIDATGRVTTIKVISGPVLLQQSAAAAVRLWKYEPATLNGNAVPMHLVVTVKFRLR